MVTWNEITPEQAAEAIMGSLTNKQIRYASDPKRGEYRGFAALHDHCDANEYLLDYVPDFDVNDDAQVKWSNDTMDEVTKLLVAAWEASQD